jgi:hypothetical protein
VCRRPARSPSATRMRACAETRTTPM